MVASILWVGLSYRFQTFPPEKLSEMSTSSRIEAIYLYGSFHSVLFGLNVGAIGISWRTSEEVLGTASIPRLLGISDDFGACLRFRNAPNFGGIGRSSCCSKSLISGTTGPETALLPGQCNK